MPTRREDSRPTPDDVQIVGVGHVRSDFVALPFVATDDGIAAGEPTECFNPSAVVMRAEALSRKEGYIGAIAFSRTGDPATSGASTVLNRLASYLLQRRPRSPRETFKAPTPDNQNQPSRSHS